MRTTALAEQRRLVLAGRINGRALAELHLDEGWMTRNTALTEQENES